MAAAAGPVGVARGMALCSLGVAAYAAAAALSLPFWAPRPWAVPPPLAAPQPVCRTFTEELPLVSTASAGAGAAERPSLGCADDDPRARPGDLRQDAAPGGASRLVPGGMRGSWRRLVGAPLDINQATAADLRLIDGLGPKMVSRLLSHRRALGGRFTDLRQLRAIKGIGAKKAALLQGALQVAPPRPAAGLERRPPLR